MRKGFGIFCIALGICCLLASVGLIAYNRWEEENAQAVSHNILQDVRQHILAVAPEESDPEESIQEEPAADIPAEMLTVPVNGYDCIGVLSIPVLELELPVLTDWSYPKLKLAPSHYFGSC